MKFQPHVFVVTRQNYYYSGEKVVEVAQGGRDYSNPSALVEKYGGEFEEFVGMTPAVEAAIEIYESWVHDCPDEEIFIAVGCTGGDTAEFEGDLLTDDIKQMLLLKAKEFDEKLPKCAQCGEILGETKYGNANMGEYTCCSEYCAEKEFAWVDQAVCEQCGEFFDWNVDHPDEWGYEFADNELVPPLCSEKCADKYWDERNSNV